VEQNAYHSLKLADQVHIVENGWIVKSGSASEIMMDAAVQRAYLGSAAAH
jgi:branched-chain amino acid transport system ATP-binding protein